jgi:hypothetical protein
VSVPSVRLVPPIALTREDAAAAVGMSLTSFEKYVQPDLRMIRRGSLRLVPVGELERWVERNAEKVA